MISLSSAQLDALLTAVMFPLARILGLMSSAPIFSNRSLPIRVRLFAGLAIAFAVVPTLPGGPSIPAGSWAGLLVLVQQALTGIAIGFVMRVIFAAVEFAGSVIGLQMGLSFATLYDPQAGGQTMVISEFIGLLVTLSFLAMNGHLLMVDVLVRSFEWLPVTTQPLHAGGWASLAQWIGTVFSAGLLISLPVIAALLVTNIGMGVLTRAAPQLNLLSIGFPVTMTIGFVMIMLGLDQLAPILESLFDRAFDAMGLLIKAFG